MHGILLKVHLELVFNIQSFQHKNIQNSKCMYNFEYFYHSVPQEKPGKYVVFTQFSEGEQI